MEALLKSPLLGLAGTLLLWQGARLLYARTRLFLLHPVLVTIAALIALLKGLGIDYETYMGGGRIIGFFLGPAVVALGVPLYRQLGEIRRRLKPLVASIALGSVLGILSASVPAMLLGSPREVVVSLAPKSVTTPIAMEISRLLGGLPPLTAVVVIVTGIFGAVLGPSFLSLIGVRSPVAMGLAMGAASHGIGTARALEEGELQGAAAGIAIGLNGIATAILTPLLLGLLRPA